jgi:transcription antitermination factor NusG
MGAKMYGSRTGPKADNDNHRWKPNEHGEIPIPPEERRGAPIIENEPGKGWFCIVTTPQGEYHCADGLSEEGIATYVPTETHWQRRRKGKETYPTELQRPLLRGYVFALLNLPITREGNSGTTYELPPSWAPIFERDGWGQSKLKVLHVLGLRGKPVPMPLEYVNAEGQRCGLAPLAEEERAGWFDERKRPALISEQDRLKAQAEADEQKAEDLRRRAALPVWAGDVVRPKTGALAAHNFTAENDNDERGVVRISREMFGQTVFATISVRELENLSRPEANGAAALRRA